MTMRAAAKILGENPYGVLRLIAEGEIRAQKVHNAAGGHTLQVLSESVTEYTARRQAIARAATQ